MTTTLIPIPIPINGPKPKSKILQQSRALHTIQRTAALQIEIPGISRWRRTTIQDVWNVSLDPALHCEKRGSKYG